MPSAPPWMDIVLYALRQTMEFIYQAFNKNITHGDNIQCVIRTVEVTTALTYSGISKTWTPISFDFPYRIKPSGVFVVNCQLQGPVYTPTYAAQGCDWSYQAGVITINYVSGLADSKTYDITFYAF